MTLSDALTQWKRAHLLATLVRFQWSNAQAAHHLGIHRTHLWRLRRDLDIRAPSRRRTPPPPPTPRPATPIAHPSTWASPPTPQCPQEPSDGPL